MQLMAKNNYFCDLFIIINMPKTANKKISSKTVHAIVEGIVAKKGKQLVIMDMREIPNAISSYFVICHGTSRPHIKALADSVEENVKEKTGAISANDLKYHQLIIQR